MKKVLFAILLCFLLTPLFSNELFYLSREDFDYLLSELGVRVVQPLDVAFMPPSREGDLPFFIWFQVLAVRTDVLISGFVQVIAIARDGNMYTFFAAPRYANSLYGKRGYFSFLNIGTDWLIQNLITFNLLSLPEPIPVVFVRNIFESE